NIRRRIRERLLRIFGDRWRASRKTGASCETIRIWEIGLRRQADRSVLIVLRDQVAPEPVVSQAGARANHPALSENLPDDSLVVRRGVSDRQPRREVLVRRTPPGRLAV